MLDAALHTLDPTSGGLLEGVAPIAQKPHSLSELVYDAIRTSIVSKRIRPGTVVAEAALATRLHVSKTPVREALLRLQSIGLVEPDGARGLRVVAPSLDAIREAFEVRLVLEHGLARLAAERATPAERDQIGDAARRSLGCAQSGDVAEGFRSWDRAFHRAVGAAARNGRLARQAGDAAVLATVLRERDVPDVQDAIQCGHQHVALADAVRRADADAAARASDAHVDAVRDLVLVAFRARYAR